VISEVENILISISSFNNIQFLSTCSRIFIWQTCNALFMVRVIFSHWIRLEKEAVLIKKFSFQEENSCESLLENLAVQLVEILVDVPLKSVKIIVYIIYLF
jgi:hypothetical protein